MPTHGPVLFKIKRQASPNDKPRWEEFELPWHAGMNVISSMMEIARNPVTRDGKPTTPITYDSNCLEEVCGSCAMLINGKARMACSALVDNLEQPIRLQPLSKFPIIRDLAVDRGVLFENLKRVKAWVPVDGTYDLGSRPRVSMHEQEEAILFRDVSRAAAAWKFVRNSTSTPDLWGRQQFHRCVYSIRTRPARLCNESTSPR